MAALRKYQNTVLQRGRASINNPCGYLISLLKKAQQDVREDDSFLSAEAAAALAKVSELSLMSPR